MSRRTRALAGRSYPWSDLDPERRNGLLLLGGIGLVVLFAIILIAYGYYTERIAPGSNAVITVGERKFDYDYLERRVKGEIARGRASVANLSEAIPQVISLIEREEMLRQGARSIGTEVSVEEIEARYRLRVGGGTGSGRELLASQVRLELVRLGLSLEEFREIVVAEILETKLRENFEAAVASDIEHVNARLILTSSEPAAIQARDRLNSGEPFGEVASSASIHTSRTAAGELGWVPTASLSKPVAAAAASLNLETRSEIIEDSGGFYIIEVTGRETQAVTPDGREEVGQRNLANLLAETRERIGGGVRITPAQIQRLARSLLVNVG